MCGIVGLYLKNAELQSQLGSMFQPMLVEMSSRGPDSAGVAIYRNPVESGQTKFSLAHDDPDFSWETLETELAARCSVLFPLKRWERIVFWLQMRTKLKLSGG